MGYAPDPIATREQCLRLLLATLPVIGKWSERLSEGDPDRQHALRRYFLALVGLEIGILREIRRGWLAGGQVILVVDEHAEHRRPVRRPHLSVRHELAVRRDLQRVVRGGSVRTAAVGQHF